MAGWNKARQELFISISVYLSIYLDYIFQLFNLNSYLIIPVITELESF